MRSNITATIPRSELGLGAPSKLDTGMLLVRGSVPVSGSKTRQFHLQIIAASNLQKSPDSQVFTQVPDLDLLGEISKAQSPDTINFVFRAVGELAGDRSMTPPNDPKDLTKSWVDLTKDSGNLEFGNLRRAWVNLVIDTTPGSDDKKLSDAMIASAVDLAKKIANDPTKVKIQSPTKNDPLGSTHHEAGTLWMGTAGNSITNQDGRFHHISNAYVAGPALFPTLGSANPSLTAMVLARNTAFVIANS
jgi:hypothetical protein